MSEPAVVSWLRIFLLGFLTLASSAGSAERARSATPGTETTTLRVSSTVPMARPEMTWWSQRADDDGNLYFLVVPEGSADPSDIHFLSADGKTTRAVRVDALPQFAGQDVKVTAIAIDSAGTLFALVWATQGRQGRYSIVAFDKGGRYQSRLEIEPETISIGKLEVFGSGEFLLLGRRAYSDAPRVAVMSISGTVTDVKRSSTDDLQDGALGPAFPGQHVARAGDGRIYFVPEGGDTVHFVEASGNSQAAFKLAPMPRDRHLLFDLKASGQRLAAVYFEERDNGGGDLWFAVYDVLVGERVALYGPVSGFPVRYQHTDGQDRFTLIRQGKELVTAVSP